MSMLFWQFKRWQKIQRLHRLSFSSRNDVGTTETRLLLYKSTEIYRSEQESKCWGFLQARSSRLILIGISNSIDIVERRLPRLKELGTRPYAVPFPSYSAAQIVDILRQRLASLPGPVFQDAAITFCARKVIKIWLTTGSHPRWPQAQEVFECTNLHGSLMLPRPKPRLLQSWTDSLSTLSDADLA